MHTKILIRSELFHLRYQHWYQNLRQQHLDLIRGSYANEIFGTGVDDLDFEYSPQYSRITWSQNELEIEVCSFMLDHFKNRLLKNNYICQISDERMEIFDSGVKLTVHRHFLKPERSSFITIIDEQPLDYGNIFLEHRFNKDYNVLCINSNYLGNKKYHSFEKLMEILLE